MDLTQDRYNKFGLVRDMAATPKIIAGFDPAQNKDTAAAIAKAGRLLMTGEGSSRIFPAKHAMTRAMESGKNKTALFTEAGRQALEYDLAGWAVFALSNSGRTAEVIELFTRLKEQGHAQRYSLTAHPDTRLESLADQGFVLTCGPEGAVAATKSVVEQALFYHALIGHLAGTDPLAPHLDDLASKFDQALSVAIPDEVTAKIAAAGTIYFAGRNDGVAEELTLKTNEITRKKSDFLEGAYAVHGVEEVMNADDVVIWIDPYPDAEAKFKKVLIDGVGLSVIAVAPRATSLPTIRVPDAGALNAYIMMAAGWNLLVEVGLKLGIDLDKPERARKVGNEFEG